MTHAVLEKLRRGRARIVDPADWRAGPKANLDDPCDTPPFCAGSALWDKGGDNLDQEAESAAIRALLTAAGIPLPDPSDEDAEIGMLVVWNDGSDHATVLATFDRAIEAAS